MKKLISLLIVVLFVFAQTFAYSANASNTDSLATFKSLLEYSYLLHLKTYSNDDLSNHSFPSLFNASNYDYIYKFGIIFPQNKSLNSFYPFNEQKLNDFKNGGFEADNISCSYYYDFFNDSSLRVYQYKTTSSKETDILFKGFKSLIDEDMKNSYLSDYTTMESKVINDAIKIIQSSFFKDKTSYKAGFYFKDNKVNFCLLKKYSDETLLNIELCSNSNTNILLDALNFSMLVDQNKLTPFNQTKENIEYKIYKMNNKDLLNINYQKQPKTNDLNKLFPDYNTQLAAMTSIYRPSVSLSFPNITDKSKLYYHFNYDNGEPFLCIIIKSNDCNHTFIVKPNSLNTVNFYKYCSVFAQSIKLR